MRSVDEHLEATSVGFEPLPAVEVALADANGYVLAHDVVSPVDLPRFDNSAMDGYAVCVPDLSTASPADPARLVVTGDLPAGAVPAAYRVVPGTAVRIMTGAPVPEGTQAVVPVEITDGGTDTVAVTGSVEEGQHIRRRGEDVSEGELLMRAGITLSPTELGLLAAIGRPRVSVRRRPRVAVLSTGSELVEPGAPVGPGQISESNSVLLVAAATDAGAEARRVATVADEPDAVLDALREQLGWADVLVTSGGVSAGAYDVVKEVLARLGTVRFDRVAMQPGMPQGFGTLGPAGTPIFTLPGNPVSAYVSFEIFVRPAIRRLLGAQPLHRPVVRAVAGQEVRAAAGKRQYLRARLDVVDGRALVCPVGGRGSHLLKDLTRANALLVVPEQVKLVAEGDLVDVVLLEGVRS